MNGKTKILRWLVVILLVTNISTVVSVFYFEKRKCDTIQPKATTEIPGDKRARYFRDQLGLDESQMDVVREVNRKFNRQSRAVLMTMDSLREQLVNEMTRENADTTVLRNISGLLGKQHAQLKVITYTFYIDLAAVCNVDQKSKLDSLFQSLTSTDKNIQLPERGHGRHMND